MGRKDSEAVANDNGLDVSISGIWKRLDSDEPMDTVEALDYIQNLLDYVDSGALNPVDCLDRMQQIIEHYQEQEI